MAAARKNLHPGGTPGEDFLSLVKETVWVLAMHWHWH